MGGMLNGSPLMMIGTKIKIAVPAETITNLDTLWSDDRKFIDRYRVVNQPIWTTFFVVIPRKKQAKAGAKYNIVCL